MVLKRLKSLPLLHLNSSRWDDSHKQHHQHGSVETSQFSNPGNSVEEEDFDVRSSFQIPTSRSRRADVSQDIEDGIADEVGEMARPAPRAHKAGGRPALQQSFDVVDEVDGLVSLAESGVLPSVERARYASRGGDVEDIEDYIDEDYDNYDDEFEPAGPEDFSSEVVDEVGDFQAVRSSTKAKPGTHFDEDIIEEDLAT